MYNQSVMDIKCCCLRMESVGIPCDHILVVMLFLDMVEIPRCLVLDRWTKSAKDPVDGFVEGESEEVDALWACRYAALIAKCRKMCKLGSRTLKEFEDTRSVIDDHNEKLEAKGGGNEGQVEDETIGDQGDDMHVRNPTAVRTKGCGNTTSQQGGRGKRKRSMRCGICRGEGHNRTTCPMRKGLPAMRDGGAGPSHVQELEDHEMYDE